MKLSKLVVLCATVVLAVGAGIATAGGGNSTNAQLCYKNGWKTQFKLDGTAFVNQDDCVSYAAHGNSFLAGTLTVVVVANTTDGTGIAAQDFTFSLTGAPNFSLDDDNNTDPTLPDMRSFNVPVGTFTVAQLGGAAPTGWTLANVSCTTNAHSSASTHLFPGSADVTFQSGGVVTCTFTYAQST
jgi:hypothetical protein